MSATAEADSPGTSGEGVGGIVCLKRCIASAQRGLCATREGRARLLRVIHRSSENTQ